MPCVTDKCPKGHYSKPIKHTSFTRRVIALHAQAKATSGLMLNKREQQDRLLAHMFSLIDQIQKQADQHRLVAILAPLIGSSKHGGS